MSGRTLVIGYGNALRGDDGVGRHVCELLGRDGRFADATIVDAHQLAPEHVVEISRADVLVLVDAGWGTAPGTFTVTPIDRTTGTRSTWSHHFDPVTLLALADELYGCSPATFVATVGIESVDVGEYLSARVEHVLPSLVDAIARVLPSSSTGMSVPGTTDA